MKNTYSDLRRRFIESLKRQDFFNYEDDGSEYYDQLQERRIEHSVDFIMDNINPEEISDDEQRFLDLFPKDIAEIFDEEQKE